MTFANYDGKGLTSPGVLSVAGNVWFRVYNNTGANIANGAIYETRYLVETTASEFADATTANPVIGMILVAPATSGGTDLDQDKQIVVVDNFTDADSELKDNKWGWAKYQGVVKALCNGGTDIAIGDQLEVLNAGTAFTQAAAASSGNSGELIMETVAIALEAYTTGTDALKWVNLLGRQVCVRAS